jgi:hypothetical protein
MVTLKAYYEIRPSIYSSISPSVRQSVHPPIHPSIHPPVCPSVRPSTYSFIHPSIHLPYANALEAWHNMSHIVNPNTQSFADLRRTPIRNSTLLTPHISGHNLVFDEAWTTLNMFFVGNLLMENCHWMLIEDINTHHSTISTIRRLVANWKTEEDFFYHHYPYLSLRIKPLTSPSPSCALKQLNGN